MSSLFLLVSGCLAGLRCRYDGKDSSNRSVQELVEKGQAMVVCPEQLGGLPTPRSRSRIEGGDGFDVLSGKARVVSEEGRDVTLFFLRGAKETLRLARLAKIKRVIFKEKSPSCGVKKIDGGSKWMDGCGVTTALLLKEGFEVVSSETLSDR